MSLRVYLWLLSLSLALAPSPLGPFFYHSEPFGPLFMYQQHRPDFLQPNRISRIVMRTMLGLPCSGCLQGVYKE